MKRTGNGGAVALKPTPALTPASVQTGTRPKRQPVRTCVACRTSGGKRGLLRVVRLPGEAPDTVRVVLDPTGKQNGRGAYLCPTLTCVQTALKRKALERSLKAPITEDVAEALRASATMADADGETPPGT